MKIIPRKVKVTKKQADCKHPKGFGLINRNCRDCGISIDLEMQKKNGYVTFVYEGEAK